MNLASILKPATLLLLLVAASHTFAQSRRWWDDTSMISNKQTLQKDGLTLFYYDNSENFDPQVKQHLIDAFFTVYPAERKRFNMQASATVVFVIDTGYHGVAATSGHIVRFNPDWFKKHPEDIDVVTHEVMHIVQSYGDNHVPGWLTEGIADYVRYKFGINNDASGWKLTDFKPTQSYTNAYRITAHFLVWAEKHKNPGLVDTLDGAMRQGIYTSELWQQLTGKNVDELWAEYSANPEI
ncbi:basic secretory protein-like protein [uncultured Mucilaginibacter sp.]|uniref:basic secretory protein-like protein n=1 Tax=uncultured Mucilaginibacter sp. TaxID=797541 RepID=UPI0025DD318F|nr:basic secretory protein-like protein [uncultured Mucilaginibacter sp.]